MKPYVNILRFEDNIYNTPYFIEGCTNMIKALMQYQEEREKNVTKPKFKK